MKSKYSISLMMFVFLLVYILSYFSVKYTHSIANSFPVAISPKLIIGQQNELIVFFEKDKFGKLLYYIFLPLGKLEKFLNKNFSYDLIKNQQNSTFSLIIQEINQDTPNFKRFKSLEFGKYK